jgi:hypothetical protein
LALAGKVNLGTLRREARQAASRVAGSEANGRGTGRERGTARFLVLAEAGGCWHPGPCHALHTGRAAAILPLGAHRRRGDEGGRRQAHLRYGRRPCDGSERFLQHVGCEVDARPVGPAPAGRAAPVWCQRAEHGRGEPLRGRSFVPRGTREIVRCAEPTDESVPERGWRSSGERGLGGGFGGRNGATLRPRAGGEEMGGRKAGQKPALVGLAGAEPCGVKGPRRGDDDNRRRMAKWEPQGTHAKGPEANLRP